MLPIGDDDIVEWADAIESVVLERDRRLAQVQVADAGYDIIGEAKRYGAIIEEMANR